MSINPVPLTLAHLQEIVRECTRDLAFAKESEDFHFLHGVVTAYMHLDALKRGPDAHVFHLDDYLVALDQSGLVVTPRAVCVDGTIASRECRV